VYLERRQYSEAIEHYQAAEQIDRARLLGEPENSAAKMDLSFDLSDLGLAMLESHRYSEQWAISKAPWRYDAKPPRPIRTTCARR